jgi:hypothetical protein
MSCTSPKGPFLYRIYASNEPHADIMNLAEEWMLVGEGTVQLPDEFGQITHVPLQQQVMSLPSESASKGPEGVMRLHGAHEKIEDASPSHSLFPISTFIGFSWSLYRSTSARVKRGESTFIATMQKGWHTDTMSRWRYAAAFPPGWMFSFVMMMMRLTF